MSKWGGYGSESDKISSGILGLAIDGYERVYVTDSNSVKVFTSSGELINQWGEAGAGDGQFNRAEGIAIGSDNSVYVVDSYNNRIQKFTSDGLFLQKWGGAGSDDGQFNEPRGIAIGNDDSVYITDLNNRRIQKFSSDGVFISKWGEYGSGDSQFIGAFHVAIDNNDNVYVVDGSSNRIQKFTSDGIFLSKWGGMGNDDGQFISPKGIGISSDGSIYVVDAENYRIQLFAYSPDAPTDLNATSIQSSQVALEWGSNSGSLASFELERCGNVGCNDFSKIANISTGITNYVDTVVQPNTAYSYRVRVVRRGLYSGYTDALSVVTLFTPVTPSDLSVSTLSGTRINISWTDNSDDETGFELERCSGNGCSGFAKVAEVTANETSYIEAGLQSGTEYSYRIRAVRSVDVSAYSDIASTSTLVLPVAPSALVAAANSTTKMNLSWTDSSDDETGFELERCSGGGCSDFSKLADVAADASSYADSSLQANTLYRYRIRAVRGEDVSAYSDIAESSTLALPVAPSALSAAVNGSTKMNLSWTDNSSDETGFEIWRCVGSGCTSFTKLTTVAANLSSYTNTGLTASTVYRYQVRAIRDQDTSGYSNIVTGTTLPLLSIPSNVTGTVLSSTSLRLTWVDGNSTETGYEVWRCVGSSCTTFTKLTTLAANATTYTNTGLAASTAYRYKVRAVRGSERSGYSGIATATTLPPLKTPSNVTGTVLTSTSLRLTWVDGNSTETGYEVWRCVGSSCTTFTKLTTLAANATTYTNTGLAASTAYRYKVRAVRGSERSGYSGIATATTLPPLKTPSNVTGTVLTSTSLRLTWVDGNSTETGYEVWRCVGSQLQQLHQADYLGGECH
ncbi:fibronectin type III domain-containing protein [Candidatus Thiothrix anitrata]|uniref:Fibronectin type III domain-containing protein n=1 Tax=Candidatus Thiothrix anitrata TaxID=2823902 RepID=A0ABX7X6J4_9GAMM|nr:fibronectin type III domain-containing protein [Candidatus Thiothrix anitrata]QTR50333.1 fibronectin type III domain-containing protein [Candidatus Thiothrix anitrata]